MEKMTVGDIASLTPINEVDYGKALSIANDIKDGKYKGPAILYHEPNNAAITGSHRVEACRILVGIDDNSEGETDYSNIELPVLDVTDYIEDFCEEEDTDFDHIPFDNLREIFEDTDIEDEVRKNEEW